ncbi:MAG: hypothetical protein ACJAS1_004390 [Oleiphilaceae bacterium]|jgi:hypothetical protein
MKISCLFLVSVLSVGCSASNQYNDEKMYDLASQFKDLAQAIDGSIKFGETEFENGDKALETVSKEYPDKVAPFAKYTIKVDMQGDNAVLLLCDADIALIEDAGCNAVLDKIYWQEVTQNSCAFTIDSHQLCK